MLVRFSLGLNRWNLETLIESENVALIDKEAALSTAQSASQNWFGRGRWTAPYGAFFVAIIECLRYWFIVQSLIYFEHFISDRWEVFSFWKRNVVAAQLFLWLVNIWNFIMFSNKLSFVWSRRCPPSSIDFQSKFTLWKLFSTIQILPSFNNFRHVWPLRP